MQYNIKPLRLLLQLLIVCITTVVTKSQTIVSGTVTDSQTGEPLAFVNISYSHSTVGTITDYNGTYHLKTYNPTDSLTANSVGYIQKKTKVKFNTTQVIDFKLDPSSLYLNEVVVTPGENPAFIILDSIKAHKKNNNPDRFQNYQYRSYNKMRLDLNNIDEAFKDQKLMKQFQFVFDHIDSSEVFGKNFLPILISESVSRFYCQKNPPVKKEIIDAFKISGIENTTVSQFSGKMYQQLNVYDNFMTLFEPGFVSPIADFGRMYYKYRIEDSANVEGNWCYKLSFKPKRTQERTFFGYFWVADTSWAIKKVQLRVSSDVNINFMNDMVAINEYQKVNDSLWFLSKEDLLIDFNVLDKTYGFFGRKQAAYDNIVLNQPIPDSIKKILTNTYIDEEKIRKDDQFWDTARTIELDSKEAEIYQMVDSIKEVPMYKTVYSLSEMLIDYYYVIGPVEIGPYYTFYSHNPLEGNRFKFGMRTGLDFSKKVRFGGHIAYGTLDQRFKYGMDVEYILNKNPRRRVYASYLHDIRQLGKSDNAFLDDNILETLLRRRPNYKLSPVEISLYRYENEWFQGFSNSIQIMHEVIYPTDSIAFIPAENNPDNRLRFNVTTFEISLNTHFAYKEKFLWGQFDQVSLGSDFPALDVNLTYAPKGVFGSQYEYFKLKISISDKVAVNPFGFTRYWITAGKIFGIVPYPLLELHDGNETYAYDRYAYNMMNYYEFASDRYASIYVEQHLQGFFFNKIPLLKRLEWREVASARLLTGSLREENLNVLEFPYGLNTLTKPYAEAGIGIENIFRVLRLEAVWRLSYLDNPDIQKFGLRAVLQLSF